MVAAARCDAVAGVRPLVAVEPAGFERLDRIVGTLVRLGVVNAREDVKLEFRAPDACIRVTRVGEGLRGARRDDARVAVEYLSRVRFGRGAERVDRGLCRKRVDVGRAEVGEEDHVSALDGLETGEARSVKPDAVDKCRGSESGDRKRDVMPATGEVREPKIEHRDAHLVEKPYELARVRRRAKSGSGFVEVSHQKSPVSVPHPGTPGHANERA